MTRTLRFLAALTTALVTSCALAQAPQVPGTGRIERLESFDSCHVDACRVEGWLPPGFESDSRYAVLYMHDGRVLFDAKSAWNMTARSLDAGGGPIDGRWPGAGLHSCRAGQQQKVPPRRVLPGQGPPPACLHGREGPSPREPCRDSPAAAPTFASWSRSSSPPSIGTSERNDEMPGAAIAHLRSTLPAPETVRLWMDLGTSALDASCSQAQPCIDALLEKRGFRPGPRFQTRVYEGAGYSEDDWSKRLHEPLQSLPAR